MNAIVDTAISRARMIFAFVVLSIAAGWLAYTNLPKEGSPNIDIPTLYVSVNYPGVSALDAERLLVKPLENQLKTIEGLKEMTGVATEGHASVALEFEFGFDKDAILAEVRAEVDEAQAEFPAAAMEPRILEINTSEFPILNVTLSGSAPERTLFRVAQNLQDAIEGITSVLEAEMNGQREELLEIVISPTRLETYGVTAQELLSTVSNNNLVVPAGAVTTDQGAFSVKVPGSIEDAEDLYNLPLKVSERRVVTLRDLGEVRRTFEDRSSIARFNGEPAISLSVKKRSGENIIATVDAVRDVVRQTVETWPESLQQSVQVEFSLDEAARVRDMVTQLESSVITAVALVMIVVVAALGLRSAVLVAFAIPTSFLLCFALLAALGMTVNNMVMFGLILAVGMLVDGAIVVTEYAEKRRSEGAGPSAAFGEAARRMFWPIVSSTATTLCAFLPMLFWPGMPGQFMRYLPITLIFVLSASLLVALIYLPVTGMIVARILRALNRIPTAIRSRLGWLGAMLLGTALAIGAFLLIRSGGAEAAAERLAAAAAELADGNAEAPGGPKRSTLLFLAGTALAALAALSLSAAMRTRERSYAVWRPMKDRLGLYGALLKFIVGNPVMPLVVLFLTVAGMMGILQLYKTNSYGVEFFVDTDPEIANLYVSARGNLAIEEKDRIMRVVEKRLLGTEDVDSALTIVGGGTGGGADQGSAPKDSIGRIQFEFDNWRERKKGDLILADLREAVQDLPGVEIELAEQADGPNQGKPIQLRLAALDFDMLQAATRKVQAHLESIEGLKDVGSTLPLPGIEWEMVIDRTEAGKYGANVQSIGTMVQLVTRGVVIDTYRPDDSDEEIDIRARFDSEDRVVEMLDRLRVQTGSGLVPLGNFVERRAVPKLAEVTRVDGVRVFTVNADVEEGVNANAKITEIGAWLKTADLGGPVKPTFVGDFEEQQESQLFLMRAFAGALGLMFIILLAQFNSFYNSALVLVAVIFSIGGVLVGMMAMGQSFSIIMTGIGVVALAGIVVNNNIVLIDTFQDLRRTLPPIEAVIQTGRQRLRPVLLTTITTIAGLLPMMFAVSIDFAAGGISVGAPTALWWTQLATAIVFGLGFATVLTLVVTPSLLALRIWYLGKLPQFGWRGLKTLLLAPFGRRSRHIRDSRSVGGAKRLARKRLPVVWTETYGPQSNRLAAHPHYAPISRKEESTAPERGAVTDVANEKEDESPEPARIEPTLSAPVRVPATLSGTVTHLPLEISPLVIRREGEPDLPDPEPGHSPPYREAAE